MIFIRLKSSHRKFFLQMILLMIKINWFVCVSLYIYKMICIFLYINNSDLPFFFSSVLISSLPHVRVNKKPPEDVSSSSSRMHEIHFFVQLFISICSYSLGVVLCHIFFIWNKFNWNMKERQRVKNILFVVTVKFD